jgi:hypothetical protein
MKITIKLELALAVTFITLKLCGVIDWPWWLVLLPLYASTALIIISLIIVLLIRLIIEPVEFIDEKIASFLKRK